MSMPLIQIDPRFAARTVGDSIYRSLREEILALRLKPGEPLNIKDVADMLKVSRSPVRDALMHLNSEGLVDVFPQRGCRVSLIDMERVRQEFFLREGLEMLAVSRAAGMIAPEDIQRMRRYVAQQRQDLQDNDMAQYMRHDNNFHDVFFEAIGQERAKLILHSQCAHYRRARMLSFSCEQVLTSVLDEHEQILDALEKKDEERLMTLVYDHIHRMNSQMENMISIEPSYFKA